MTIRVVDHKKLDMTEDEFAIYQKIVKSYTTSTNKGEDLFTDLFEVDGRGIIIFLKPPSVRRTSFEVWLFLMSLMQNQHLRQIYLQVEDIANQMKEKLKEINEKLANLEGK
jgi:hypothetical protein